MNDQLRKIPNHTQLLWMAMVGAAKGKDRFMDIIMQKQQRIDWIFRELGIKYLSLFTFQLKIGIDHQKQKLNKINWKVMSDELNGLIKKSKIKVIEIYLNFH